MLAGFLLGAFAGVYSELTRTPGAPDAAGNGITMALVFGIPGTAFGAVLAFLLRLLSSRSRTQTPAKINSQLL